MVSHPSTPSPSPANTPPNTSSESGSKLMKIFAKNPWDETDDTYPEWMDKALDMLGLSPKVLEQYQDPIAATKDPELALITCTALLAAVEKSNAHAIIHELPQQKKTGYLFGSQWKRPWMVMIALNLF